ncbi:MAG TPA: trypsin-like peptidase domain-containing protein [Gaiellaceae bacterium]
MKSWKRGIATALGFLVAGAAGAGIALGLASALGGLSSTTVVNRDVQTPTSLQTTAATGGKALTASEIYKRTASGVVQVTTKSIVAQDQINPFFPSQSQSQVQEALGSGFVIDKQGHIVTNYHVVEGASSIEVLFSNNVTTKAKVVATDKSTDLAVLKVDVSPSALTPLSFGDSSAVQVGDSVVAIGNPFGLDRTITSGIVSAIYNIGDESTTSPLTSSSSGSGTSTAYPIAAIQTDAAINHGNSGGPLLNSSGQVIGVNTAIETGSTTSSGNVGIGFAVQSNTVKQVVAQILKNGKATHAFLGISIQAITPEVANLFRLPVKEGLLIADVTSGTGGAKAGLKGGTREVTVSGYSYMMGGDIIVKADGVSVGSSTSKLESIIATHKPGDKLTLEIYRGSQKKTVTVTLGNRS